VYPADRELTPDNIKQFLADVKEHKLVRRRFTPPTAMTRRTNLCLAQDDLRHHPSEQRPAEDNHPEGASCARVSVCALLCVHNLNLSL
jgi:hypothetical protein